MNVAIIGNGGREHAICTYIKKSNKIDKVYCIPGNAGTGHIATNIEIDIRKHILELGGGKEKRQNQHHHDAHLLV